MITRFAIVTMLVLAGIFSGVVQGGVAHASGVQQVVCHVTDGYGNRVAMNGEFVWDGQRVSNDYGPNVGTNPARGWSVSSQQSGFSLGSGGYTGFYWANVTFTNGTLNSSLYPRINVAADGGYSYQSCFAGY